MKSMQYTYLCDKTQPKRVLTIARKFVEQIGDEQIFAVGVSINNQPNENLLQAFRTILDSSTILGSSKELKEELLSIYKHTSKKDVFNKTMGREIAEKRANSGKAFFLHVSAGNPVYSEVLKLLGTWHTDPYVRKICNQYLG